MQTNEFEKIFTAFWIRKNKKNNDSHNVIRYINLGGKKYVFKHPTKADSTISIVNEVIASIILKDINAPTIKYYNSKAKTIRSEIQGNLSENFLKDNNEIFISMQKVKNLLAIKDILTHKKDIEKAYSLLYPLNALYKKEDIINKLITLNENADKISESKLLKNSFVANNRNAIDYYVSRVTNNNKIIFVGRAVEMIKEFAEIVDCSLTQNIEDELIKMTVADIVTGQADRHECNLGIILNKKERTVRLAPMFDNEFAFYIINFSYDYDNLILSPKHYMMLADKKSEIGKYYEQIKDYYYSGKLDNRITELKQSFNKSDEFWGNVKSVYISGLDYIDEKIKNCQNYQENSLIL